MVGQSQLHHMGSYFSVPFSVSHMVSSSLVNDGEISMILHM